MFTMTPQTAVYTTAQVRQLDQIAIHEQGIAGYDLMCRAGQAAFASLISKWPHTQTVCVMCGAGNNAGDGYVIARLAQQAGLDVDVISLIEPNRLQGDAQQAYQDYLALGENTIRYAGTLSAADVYVDALLGTGLSRALSDQYLQVIQQLNAQTQPILAIDIPSGLNGDTGQPQPAAIKATVTITFIAWKQGLLTGQARDYCGELVLANLDLPQAVYQAIPTPNFILNDSYLQQALPKRKRSAHKGNFGRSVLIGGNAGMSGAIQLAGQAALRTGSGLVSIITHEAHAPFLNVTQPELMVLAATEHNDKLIADRLYTANALGIGPGLGQSAWSQHWFKTLSSSATCRVLDADALNLLAQTPHQREDWILTPHPTEAARLLGINTQSIELDRVQAAQMLQKRYGGVIVLKGAGSIIASATQCAFCMNGNPGMASGGMGDLLTGIITALLAQGFALFDAAALGVFIHAQAGDLAAQQGERGLIASDVLACIRIIVNP
jgi:NAD(P)H-hydrate epimerase